ncbi:hypothetical protein D3C71_314370 [compost metagenome]
MFLPNPGLLVAGNSAGVPYAVWLAYINAKPSTSDRTWTSSAVLGNEFYRVACNSTDSITSLTLYGSTWQSRFRSQSNVSHMARIVQHALPSEAVFNAQRAARKVVLMKFSSPVPNGPALSVNRNGYVSIADGSQPYRMDMIAWHDETTQQVLMSNPFEGSAPMLYASADWNP